MNFHQNRRIKILFKLNYTKIKNNLSIIYLIIYLILKKAKFVREKSHRKGKI